MFYRNLQSFIETMNHQCSSNFPVVWDAFKASCTEEKSLSSLLFFNEAYELQIEHSFRTQSFATYAANSVLFEHGCIVFPICWHLSKFCDWIWTEDGDNGEEYLCCNGINNPVAKSTSIDELVETEIQYSDFQYIEELQRVINYWYAKRPAKK